MPSRNLGQEFLVRIKNVVGKKPVSLHEPVFAGNEKKYLSECIDSGYVSSVGQFVSKFETCLRDYAGAAHAIAVVNGTTALQLGLIATGVQPNDEVIVPALSFVATANAVSHSGAVPHFVDVDEKTWSMSPTLLASHLETAGRWIRGKFVNRVTGRPITAVVPMHTLGHPADIIGLVAVAEKYNLRVIEDAAESLGSLVGSRHTGLFGEVGVFSFNGNKTVTTGGGGVLVTNNRDLAARIRHLSTTARVPHPSEFIHDEIGFNYRMPNINAALGVAQMEKLPAIIQNQRLLFTRYAAEFEGFSAGKMKQEQEGTRSNYWLQAFLLEPENAGMRDSMIATCLSTGVGVRPLWKPLNKLAPYVNSPSSSTPVAESLYKRTICLPSSASLGGTIS